MADTATKPRAKRAAKQDAGDGDDQLQVYNPADFGGMAAAGSTKFADVPLKLISIEPGFNPRQHYDEDAIAELAESLKTHGMVQPLILRQKGKSAAEGFWLTGGHRRFKAAALAGFTAAPAIIRTGGDTLAAAVLDNSHRVDLNPQEEALVYARAMGERGLTPKGVAQRFNVAQKRVTERLRILECPMNVQEAIGAGTVSVLDAPWFADINAKSPVLAAALGQYLIDKGNAGLHWRWIDDVIDQTKGVTSMAGIRAGSSRFKLNKPDVKAAVEAIAAVADKYQGWEYNWRAKVQGDSVMVDHDKDLRMPTRIGEEGVKVGAVLHIETSRAKGWACLDPKWLQDTLEREVLATYKSMTEYRSRSKAAGGKPSAQKASELTDVEKREREAKKADRERKARERNAAIEANKQLGVALVKHLGEVPVTLDSIKALCLMLLPKRPNSTYGMDDLHANAGTIAAGGLRYVREDWQVEAEVRGKKRMELQTDLKALDAAFWTWWDEAKTVEQVIGRTLTAFAAIHYADRRAAMSKEEQYRAMTQLPGHEEAAACIERLFDKHAPAKLRKRGKGARKGVPLVEVLADDEGEAA